MRAPERGGPLLATATLARLYLAQGRVGPARAIRDELAARGDPGAAAIDRVMRDDAVRREAALRALLARVRTGRRG